MISIKKQYTDDPLLDQIIYDVSVMATGCVLKNPTEVEKNETLESLENFNLYESCIKGTASFNLFEYDASDLKSCPFIPDNMIDHYLVYMDELSNNAKSYILNKKTKRFIDEYVEMNNYYRMLNGKPDYGTKGLSIAKCGVDLSKYGINIEDPKNTYMEDLSTPEIDLLDSEDVLDIIYENNKSYKYLKYIGRRKVDVYTARKASNFSVLYIPQSSNSEVYVKYVERLDVNRVYFINCFYSDAYKMGNDYFDSYMIFMIIVNSMLDMITLSHEYIIKREIFDLRTVQYILESNGVKFFSNIPMKYQKRLVRNLNLLIKYKSSDKNIVDICSLFGFDDIETFKYYLHKNRNKDSDGNYINNIKLDDDGNEINDVESNYNLKFIRVPLDSDLDDCIRNSENYYDYEFITEFDKTWNGPYSSDYIKKKLLEEEFNAVRTKYISIDTVTEMTNLAFELPYFINMIMNVSSDDVDISKLYMYCAPINPTASFNMLDIFVYLYSLMYEYYGVEDDIMYDTSKVLYIQGFNFEADMDELATYVEEKHFTLKDLGVDDFIIPTKYLSFTQLVNIYTNNKNIYDHVVHCLRNAENKRIYDIYKKIYDSLMITKINTQVYKLPDGNVASTYCEYLKFKNTILYNSIMELRELPEDNKQDTISIMINNVCDVVYDYLGSDDLKYIFSNLPAVSMDYVKKYMESVISFFKSYRVTMLNVGSIYKFKDKGKPTIVDEILYSCDIEYKSLFDVQEKMYNNTDLSYKEKMDIIDKIYIDIIRTIEKKYSISIKTLDILFKLSTDFIKNDKLDINDFVDKISFILYPDDKNLLTDNFKYLKILLNKLDKIRIQDKIYIDYITFKDIYIDSILESIGISKEKIPLQDTIYSIKYTD